MGVEAGHDEADYALCEYTPGKGVSRTNPVADEGAEDSAGDVEQVDYGVPAEGFPERGGVAENDVYPGGRVDAEGVSGEVVDEPDQGDDQETEPVESEGAISEEDDAERCKAYLMTSHHGTLVSFIVSRLNSSGSLNFIRR